MKKTLIFWIFILFTTSLSSQNQLRTTSADLNFRTKPLVAENNIICVIHKGTIISVNYNGQENNAWLKVNYNGRVGYVYSRYVSNVRSNNSTDIWNRNDNNYRHSGSEIRYYTNSSGERVQSPTYYQSPPAGATAQCRNGTYSFSRNRRGTCSGHGGVRRWL